MAIMGMGEEINGQIPVVLKVDINCECDGCVKKIRDGMNSIKDFEGVERIWKDYNTGMITVFGSMDPQMLCNKLSSKTKKSVEIVFLPTGNSPQTMTLESIIPSSNHGYGSPSAPPIREMSNLASAVQSRSRDAERIRQLEEQLEAQRIELEQCRRLIGEIYLGK